MSSLSKRQIIILTIFLKIIITITADKIIKTNSGYVQGITVKGAQSKSKVEAYLGIPYAVPPLGRLRFEKPVPISSWKGVYEAIHKPPPCLQYIEQKLYYLPDTENMTEDCLYLNIWVPQSVNPYGKRKSIIIWIHGGAFVTGSSSMDAFDGAVLADFGDIIVASMNYRLGALGFFSAFTKEIGGNMGTYDVILAIKWIKHNAVAFGGDADQITLMGESSGAMCASALLIYPAIQGLFRRVILESGSTIIAFHIPDNAEIHLKMSKRFSELAGCANKTTTIENSPRLVLRCLKGLTSEEILKAEVEMKKGHGWWFIPRIGEALLPSNATEQMRTTRFMDTEVLIGINKDEGSLLLTSFLPEYFGYYGHNVATSLGKSFIKQIMRLVLKNTGQTSEDELANYYMDNINEPAQAKKYIHAFSQAVGDYLITCGTLFFADIYSIRNNPAYFYQFTHRSSNSPLADWMGTTHYEAVPYTFGAPLKMPENYTNEEIDLSKRLMKRWVTFAKTGNPNIPEEIYWPTYSYKDRVYLNIDTKESICKNSEENRCDLWRERFDSIIDQNMIEAIIKNRSLHISKNNVLILIAIAIILVL